PPRARTAAMIAATSMPTSASASRRAATSASKAAAKPGSRLSSLAGIGGPGGAAKGLDQGGDLAAACLECRAIDDQPRADLGDHLHLDQPVLSQRPARGHQIDDP